MHTDCGDATYIVDLGLSETGAGAGETGMEGPGLPPASRLRVMSRDADRQPNALRTVSAGKQRFI